MHRSVTINSMDSCPDYLSRPWRHDDVIKWKHFPRYCPFVRGIHRSPVNSPHKGQWRGALIFSLICAWINAWVNNREAGHYRRHRAPYDVIVIFSLQRYSISSKIYTWYRYALLEVCTITVTSQWARWRLKLSGSWLFTQQVVQAQIKENIKTLRHWPLWGEFTGERWIPRTKGQ